MRQLPFETIQNYLGDYANNGTSPPVSFLPIPDDGLVFANYSDRYARHLVSDRPAIISTCEDEGNGLVPSTCSGVLDPAQAIAVTRGLLLCPAVHTSNLRAQAGLSTYRSLYVGNFSSLSPLPWMGSYHTSDLPMLFSTYENSTNAGQVTAQQRLVSRKMQNSLSKLAHDPWNGLAQYGWPEYTEGEILQYGAADAAVSVLSAESVDDVC